MKKRARKIVPKIMEEHPGKVVRAVNRHAWIFKPDVLITVGLDFANDRIVVKLDGPGVRRVHFDHMSGLKRAVESAARQCVTKERIHKEMHLADCPHPKYRVKKKRYLVENTPKGTQVWAHGKFCTKCGTMIEKANEVAIIARVEAVQKEHVARKPKVRRIREAL